MYRCRTRRCTFLFSCLQPQSAHSSAVRLAIALEGNMSSGFLFLGVAPFTLLLPHVNLFWTTILSVFIGLILASAFSAILVYAQELLPGKVGTVSGLFFGFAFGMGGLGSAVLGRLADNTNIYFVYTICAYLPLIGLLTGFLPNIGAKHKATS